MSEIIADSNFFHEAICSGYCSQCKNFDYEIIINGKIYSGYEIDFVYFNDKIIHRDGGPAVRWVHGTEIWTKCGKYHRENGPAIEYSDGSEEWSYEGKFLGSSLAGYTQEDFDIWKRFKAFV